MERNQAARWRTLVTTLGSSARTERRCLGCSECRTFFRTVFTLLLLKQHSIRVEMFRYEQTYDLLITHHSLEGTERKRPELRSQILFLGRNGTLETELWGKDAAFRGGAMPHFFTRSGEQGLPDSPWIEATLKVTEAVCCTGCRHCHLLEAGTGRHALEVPA